MTATTASSPRSSTRSGRSSWQHRPASSPATRAIYEACRAYPEIYGKVVHGWQPEPHILEWIGLVLQLWRGELRDAAGRPRRRLAIVGPPGTAKSQWLAITLVCWLLGRRPDHALLYLTNSERPLAYETARAIEGVLATNGKHAATFPDRRARPDEGRGWSLDGYFLQGRPSNLKDATYRAQGYGSRILGARVNGIVLDDPLDQNASQNPVLVKDALGYHNQTVSNRLRPDGWELALFNRWANADMVAGLKANPAWVVREYPIHTGGLARPEPYAWGEYLWPGLFGPEWCAEKREEVGTPMFTLNYLLDPAAMAGDVFKHDSWLRPFPPDFHTPRGDGAPTLRESLVVIQTWDIAFSARETACWTVCLTLGVDRTRNLYVLSVLRRRIAADPRDPDPTAKGPLVDAMVAQIEAYRPRSVVVEEGAYQTPFVRDLVDQVTKRATVNIKTRRPVGDKVTRLRLPAAVAERGQFFVDRDAPWFTDYQTELLSAPNSDFMDQADATSLAAEEAAEIDPTAESRFKPIRKEDAWGKGSAFPSTPGARR